MLDVCGMINTHFHTLKESNLSFEVKSTEYSKVEKLFSGIPKDKRHKYLEGLNDDVYDILVRDMAAESINILKHTLSIMSDLLEINWGALIDKQKVLRQLIMITLKNASLSHNSDITCKAFQCIRFLCDSETVISHDSTALKGVVAKCLDTTLRNEEPLKLQSLLLLKTMLLHKLWDCKENTNNWLKYLTNCIFDKNAKIRGAALSTFNIFKAFLSGKEDYLDQIATNLIPLKYSKFLIELVPIDKNWAVIWRLMVEIMGKRLHNSSILVNSLLAVEEKAFKTPNIETKKEAFTSWKTLILNFASEHSVLTSERRVKLITIPLRANNCRSLDMAQVKLDVWWYVVTLMRSDVARFQETVLIPFLKFCFGPLNDGSLLSSNGQSMLNSTSNGEALGRIYPAVRMPCLQALAELLSKSAGVPLPKELAKDLVITPLLEPPLVSQKDFCHSSRVLTQCIGEVVLLVGQDLEQLPWIIHAWQSLLILINKGTGETISFNLNDSNSKDLKCVAMVKDTLRLLVNLLDAVATMSEAKAYGQVVLSMIKSLVIGDAALHASVLNSHVYAVGSTQVMNGTPTMLLAMLLLSPTILNDKTSHTRYMEVFSKLLTLGLNGIVPLPFARALLKKLEAHVSSEQFSSAHMSSLREIWISIVNHLSDAIDNGSSISEGNDAVHDFQCIYGLLMLPISHFLKSEFEKESIETLLKPWKRLFELFFVNAQLVITTQSSEIIEELCKKILVAAKKINVSSNYIAHLMQFVLIIYGVNFYESYWKVSKSPPQAAAGLALKGEKMNVFYNSQQLLIMLFYKISELMPLSNDDNGSTDKHSSIIQFLILMFSSALRYNFLNFLFDKGVICVGYYLKLTAGQLKYKTSLEKEMVKLWEKFLEYIEKKVFFTKGKFQPLIDIVTPLLEKGFTHPLPKIVELTTSHWIRSLGQICSKAKINKSLSDILDCTLKDTSGSEDVTEMATLEEKAFKSPKILRNTNRSEKALKIVSDVNQSMTSKGNNVEFKVIPPKTKAPVLTDHQKEMLKVRRVDIPALYQDLTQDSASQSFSSEILPSPALNPASSSLASDISEDANPPFSKENDLHKEKVLSATKRISQFTELNILNSKATEITGNGDKTLQSTSRSEEGNGDDDDPSKMQNTDKEGILSPKGSDQPPPVLPSELDRMANTRKRRKQNLTSQVNNFDKLKPDCEDVSASVVMKTYSNTSTRKRKETGLTKDKSYDKVAPKFSGYVLTPKREVVVNSSVCGIEVSKADCSLSKESNSEILEGTNFVGLISDDGSKKSNKLSSELIKSTSVPQKLNTDATTSLTLTDISMPNLAVENLPHELKTTEVSSELLDPSTGMQRSTSEAATNLLLPTSSSNTEDSGLRNQTLVSQKPTSKAEVSSHSANHVPPKSNVDARSELASPVLGAVKRVLRKSVTKRQSNLHQSKVLHLQDFAKENEIPSVSSGEVTTGPKKRGKPKEMSNISSPSTSSNTGRNKRKSNDIPSLECTLNVAEDNFKDTADNKETKCDKELPISSIADLNPCSEENVDCDEKLSVVDQEDNSFNASKVMKNEVTSNNENSSNNEKKERESAKLVKDKPSQLNSNVNTCGNQEECSRETKESSGVDSAKSISSSSSPKSKLSHGSPKSKSLGQSPSLDKWVIVTKRESGGKVLKKEYDAPDIQVISADEVAKDVSNSVEGGSSTEHDFSSEDIVDSSQEPMDTSSSSLKGVTKKCTVHLSRMSEIFSNEVAFIPFEGKILKCNLSPSKKEESKGDSDSKRSALANGSSVATNLFLSPRSNTSRGARILNLAQGNKERDAFEESSGSPLKEVDSKHTQLNSDNLQGSPLSHLRSPEYGNSTPPMKRPRRIRPVQIGNVSPQYRSLEIGCVVSDGDITIHNYSPNASPGGSLIKKRKIPQELGEDSISPSSKKSRRVSFADPIVSKHVEFCIPESERKFKKRGVNRCLKMPYGSPDERLLINEDDFGHSEIDVKEPSVNVADNEATSPIKAPSSLPCSEEPNDVEKPLTVDVGSSVTEEQSSLEKLAQQNSLIIDSQKCLTSVSVTDTDVIVLSPPMEGKHSNSEKQNLKPSSGISDEPTAAKEMMPHKKVLFSSQAGQKEDPCVKESQSLTGEPTQSNSTSVSANDQDTILFSPPIEDKNSNGAERNLTSSLGVSAELTADDEDVISNQNVPLSSQTEHEPCVKEPASSVGELMQTNPPPSEEVLLCDARQQLQESISSSQISDSQILSGELNLESVCQEVDPEPRTHRLNSKEEACPSLRDCSDPVDEVLSQLTSRHWKERCKSVLESRSIMTIGDLSRLTEEAVQYIPFRMNKWKNLKAALNAYQCKLDGKAALENSPEIDSMLTVKEETSGEMKMKIFREMLSKLSVQEVAKELHFVNMAEDVIQEIGNNMQVISSSSSPPAKHAKGDGDDIHSEGLCVNSAQTSKSVASQVSDDELGSIPFDVFQSLTNRSDLKDLVGELSVEKMMQLLKCVAAVVHEKESLSDGSVDVTARRILQCVLSKFMIESESTDSVNQLLWLFQNTLSSQERLKSIPSLLNCIDACLLAELILKEESIMKNIQNQISPSKALLIPLNSLSQSDLSSLLLDERNRLGDILDESRTTEDLVDRFSYKIKQRLSKNHDTH